jgi:hypothetical protein
VFGLRKFLRITSRILFVLVFAFFATFFVGEGLLSGELKETGMPMELLIMVISFLIMLIGFITSFKSAKFGGILVFAGGIFNAAYMIIRGGLSDIDAALIFGLPFIIIGLLIITTEKKEGFRF